MVVTDRLHCTVTKLYLLWKIYQHGAIGFHLRSASHLFVAFLYCNTWNIKIYHRKYEPYTDKILIPKYWILGKLLSKISCISTMIICLSLLTNLLSVHHCILIVSWIKLVYEDGVQHWPRTKLDKHLFGQWDRKYVSNWDSIILDRNCWYTSFLSYMTSQAKIYIWYQYWRSISTIYIQLYWAFSITE